MVLGSIRMQSQNSVSKEGSYTTMEPKGKRVNNVTYNQPIDYKI